MLLNLTILPGDGIGSEVTEQAVLVLHAVAGSFGHQVQLQTKLIGGAALEAANDPLPADTVQACLGSSAVLLGAVGSPAFDHRLVYPTGSDIDVDDCTTERRIGVLDRLLRRNYFPTDAQQWKLVDRGKVTTMSGVEWRGHV